MGSANIFGPGVQFDEQGNPYTVDPQGNRVPYTGGSTRVSTYHDPEYLNMTPEQRLQSRMLAETSYTRDSNRAAVEGAMGLSAASSAGTNDLVNQMTWDRLGNQQELLAAAQQGDQTALGMLGMAGANANNADQDIISAQRALWGGATAADQQSVNQLAGAGGLVGGLQDENLRRFGTGLEQYTNEDQQLADQMSARADSFENLQASPWGPDLQSQAARASADPNAIAAQRSALGQYGQIAGGSQDLGSQLAGVQGDAGALAAQRRALGGLEGVGAGSLDRQSALAGAYADPDAIAMQRDAAGRLLDFAGQQGGLPSAAEGIAADPEAIAAQRGFLSQYQAGSNPSMSATERFMLEQARRTQEQELKASRDATLRNLQARGMLGSGDELAAMLGAQSTTSQNRMMADLAALASAQQRAERQQAQGSALAGDMRASSFGEQMGVANAKDAMSLQNRDATMDALSRYTDLGGQMRGASFDEAATRASGTDATAASNAQARLAGMGQAGNYATDLQQQLFGQAATRASAADEAAVANRDVRLGGLDAQTGLATGMRDSSFTEGMATGTAADSIAQFNRSGSIAQSNYNTALQQQQQNDAWDRYSQATGVQLGANQAAVDRGTSYFDAAQGNAADQYARAGDLHEAQTGATNDAYTRSENLANAGYDANQAAYQRNAGFAGATQNTSDAQYARGSDANAMYQSSIDDFYARQRDSQNDLMGYTGLYTNQGTQGTRDVNDVLKLQLGGLEADKAKKELEDEDFDILNPSTYF